MKRINAADHEENGQVDDGHLDEGKEHGGT